MFNPFAAFHERRAPLTCGYMCNSSVYTAVPSDMVTGNFPKGVIVVPFTARGIMLEDRRLSGCSLRLFSTAGPATDTSAPESGRTGTVEFPFKEDM